MDINAKLDVGDNVTTLIERLAEQIGVTADKVFPWYVQQAYLQGITTMAAIALAVLIFVPLFIVACRRADFDKGNAWAPVSVATGIALCMSLIATFVAGPQQIRKMVNPQFYAVTMLAEDIGKLRTGRGGASD